MTILSGLLNRRSPAFEKHHTTRGRFLFFFIVLFNIAYSSDVSSDKALLYVHVSTLVNTPQPRNHSNIDMLDSVARYIQNEFIKYGFEDISIQEYDVRGRTYKNVIASIGPQNTEVIVVGAHYDVCGNLPGADDNASGIAGLLEIARLLFNNRERLKNRIEFVAYSLEEPPYFNTRFMGSYIHASSLINNFVKVKLMLCFEMIGYFSDEKNTQEYPLRILKLFYGSKGDFIACVSNFRSRKFTRKLKSTFNKKTQIKSKSLIAPSFLPGIDFSDHKNYWGYKIPAVMITDGAFYRNKNYHSSFDTIETLHFEKMAQVVNGTVRFILEL